MAEIRSLYYFSSEGEFENAKAMIRDHMYQDYWDSDKIYFEGYVGGGEYCIRIMSDCSNPENAASYCREHGGQYRPR